MEKQSKSISLVCFGFGLAAKYFVKELLKNIVSDKITDENKNSFICRRILSSSSFLKYFLLPKRRGVIKQALSEFC